MKKLILILVASLSTCALGQSFSGRSSGDVRVVPPYKLCFGEDNGTDVCLFQNGNGTAGATGTLPGAAPVKTPSVHTAASYAFTSADATKLTVFNSAVSVAATISTPVTTGFGSGKVFSMVNGNIGTVTVTCGCNMVLNGATSGTFALSQGDFVTLYSDGSNTYYGEGGSFALTATSNTFSPGTVQTFQGDPNGVLPAIVLGLQNGISPGQTTGSILGLQTALSSGTAHMGWWDGQSTLSALVMSSDTACDLLHQCTGDPTTPVATQKNPQFVTPNIDNATGISVSIPNNPNGNFFDLQKGVSSPFCQIVPLAGHIYSCFGSDGKFQFSYDGAPLEPVLVQGPYIPADFTTANNTNLQNITAGGVTLGFSKQAKAAASTFRCVLMYSQATANVAVAFGIQAVTANPTNISASGDMATSATAKTSGILTGLATTSATAIVSATPSALGPSNVFRVVLDGTIEDSAHANTFNIMVSTATGADAVTVKRGSYCSF